MRLLYALLLISLTLITDFLFASTSSFTYISPKPGSAQHLPQTSILLKTGEAFNSESISQEKFAIVGSKSGNHSFRSVLSMDGRTLILKPDHEFACDETVTVTSGSGLYTISGNVIEEVSFSFSTRRQLTSEETTLCEKTKNKMMKDMLWFDPMIKKPVRGPFDSLTSYKILVNNNPAPGRIFYNNQNDFFPNTNCFSTIIENTGKVVWASDMGVNGHDFKINYNGYMTYYNYQTLKWMMMDSNYNVIDSFQCTNGFELETNGHDFVIYPDGHCYLIAYDVQIIDMSQYVPGGKTNATVTGLIIQELDPEKNLVFEWRSWDYIDFTDADNNYPLTSSVVDYVHGNAVEEDVDGNLMYSARNCCEIVKINTNTGDIIWRLGGENNDFTFINDPLAKHFAFQHDVRLLPNGHITIFNNGNTLQPQESSAKEYDLDQVNMKATLSWQYIHPFVNGVPLFATATGSVQRLANGNTLIDWGTLTPGFDFPNFTEVNPSGDIVWEFQFDSTGEKSYRAHKYEWNPCSRVTDYTMQSTVTSTKAKLMWGRATGAKKFKIDYKPVGTSGWSSVTTQKTTASLSGLTPNTSYVWRIKTMCVQGMQSAYSEPDTFKTSLRLENPDQLPLDITLYPNPVGDQLHITMDIATDEQVTISVMNALGAEVCREDILNGEASVSTIEVSQWNAGVYIVSVFAGDEVVTKKFIKE